MTVELEHETEAKLIQRAREEGKRPEEYAAELLRHSLDSSPGAPSGSGEDPGGWLRNPDGTVLGFDGLTWRQIAHLGHKY